MEKKKKVGRPRLYSKEKKNVTIGLTDKEKRRVKKKFGTIQAFIEWALDAFQKK